MLPLPAPTPVPATGNQRLNNLVVLDYSLWNKPAKSYKGMFAKKRRLVGPKTFVDTMDSDLAERCKAAMDAEMESIQKNDVWDIVPLPKKGKIMGSC